MADSDRRRTSLTHSLTHFLKTDGESLAAALTESLTHSLTHGSPPPRPRTHTVTHSQRSDVDFARLLLRSSCILSAALRRCGDASNFRTSNFTANCRLNQTNSACCCLFSVFCSHPSFLPSFVVLSRCGIAVHFESVPGRARGSLSTSTRVVYSSLVAFNSVGSVGSVTRRPRSTRAAVSWSLCICEQTHVVGQAKDVWAE